jgi:hypothetical protein
MRARIPAFVLLFTFVAFAVYVPSPVAAQVKDGPKDKDKDKEQPKLPEWPTQIGGKGLIDWLKDATENPDPAVREFALKTLPGFGPSIKKTCSKKLLDRMSRELDPGVRITVFNIAATIGLEEGDLKEAIIILAGIVDRGVPGGLARLHAVQTLGLIGPKAEGAVLALTGIACDDPSYVTRQSIANTLGKVGFDDKTGPNTKALSRLAGALAKDKSAAVRMEALQSLVLLGPPWAEIRKPDDKKPLKIDWAKASDVADRMRHRVGLGKGKEPVETDKQLEIWCRVVLMRFDEKELAGETHLNAIAEHLKVGADGPKLQALQALGLFGERAGSQIDKVVVVLDDDDPLVLATALNTVAAMGEKGRPALDKLKAREKYWMEKRDKRKQDEDFKKAIVNLKPDQIEILVSSLQEEQLRKACSNTIEFINNSKPGKPGGDMVGAAPAPPEKKP